MDLKLNIRIIFESVMMFLPRNNILSWRSKICAISNDDSYVAGELKQHYDVNEQRTVSSENLPDSSSVQDLASLFSKLSLYDTVENAQDESNSVIIGFKDKRANQDYFPSSWHFSNTQEPNVRHENNRNFSNYFALPFQPLFSSILPSYHGSVVVYKSTNIRTECAEPILAESRDFHRQDYGNYCLPTTQAVSFPQWSSFATNHSFIDPFSSFYRYRSRFSSFLETLLIRAGRLKENFGHSVRQNVRTYDSLSEREECTAEMQQKHVEYPLLVRRIPSEQQETYPEEQMTCTEHSQTVIEEVNALSADYEFGVKEVTLIEESGAEIGKQETYIEEQRSLDEVQELLCLEQGNEELNFAMEQERVTPEDEFYPDEELPLVRFLENETLMPEQDMYLEEELTLVEELRVCLTPEQGIDCEEELTLVAEQENLTQEQETCTNEELNLVENLEKDSLTAEQGIYQEELTLVEERDDCIEEKHTSNKDRDGDAEEQWNCIRDIDNVLADIEAHLREVYGREEDTCIDGQETYPDGQETYLEGPDIYLEGQETYLEGQETYLEGQETYLEGQETYLEGQETYLEEQGTNFEQEGMYLQGNETYFEGLGEETFQIVRNVSPRARDLLQRARNLSRY